MRRVRAPKAQAIQESNAYRLATLDWGGSTNRQSAIQMGMTAETLRQIRKHPEYLEALDLIKKEFMQDIMNCPQTTELKRQLHLGAALSIKKLIEIVRDPLAPNKDVTSASRLILMADGRFLRSDTVLEDDKTEVLPETVNELIRGMRKPQ